MTKKYKVSDFSRLMGVSIKTLKHYEKFDILTPEKDEENNYRYYKFYHGERLLSTKNFTSLGFTVKDTCQYMSNKGIHEIIEGLTCREIELAKEMESMVLLQERLLALKQQCILFRDKPNTFMMETRKSFYLLNHIQGHDFIEEENIKRSVKHFMDCMPHTMKLYLFPQNYLSQDITKPILALGINAETAKRLNFDVSEPMQFFNEVKCFLYIYSDFRTKCDIEDIVKNAMDIMTKEGYVLDGDIIVEAVIDQYIDHERIFQLLIWMPVKE